MYASGNLLAKELKYSDFGIDEGSPGEGFLEDYGSTVFIGQTVLDNLYFLAVNTRSFDLHFPLNQQATRLLRNQALKIYGGTIAVRSDKMIIIFNRNGQILRQQMALIRETLQVYNIRLSVRIFS